MPSIWSIQNIYIYNRIKGTVSVISSELSNENGNTRFTVLLSDQVWKRY